MCVVLSLSAAEVETLIRKGYLGDQDLGDPDAIQFAATCFISDALGEGL